MKTLRLAIIVQNVIQWYSIRPLAKFLTKQPQLHLDIILYDPTSSTSDFHNIANDTTAAIKANGFSITTTPKTYKVCLSPYSNMINFDCQYKLGYCYGAATTKPLFTLNPSLKIGFHGLFVHDTYGAEIFSVYGRTYLVPYLYLAGTKHVPTPHKKPVVLFLPTYHEPSTAKTITALKPLKAKYHIIVKNHHGIDNLSDESNTKSNLTEIADEVYPSTFPIQKLFAKSDVVLSDSSGATMDALYAHMPVAISAAQINQSIPHLNTLQYELVQNGVIPYAKTQTPAKLDQIITTALSKPQQKKQAQASDSLFPCKSGGAEAWFRIIKQYLDDTIDTNYCAVHDYLADSFTKLELINARLSRDIDNLNLTIQNLESDLETARSALANSNTQLQEYENSRAHNLVNRAQRIIHRSH